MKIAKIINSGMTPVEKETLKTAKKEGFVIGGHCLKQEKSEFEEVKNLKSTRPEQSVIQNVKECHALLILSDDSEEFAESIAVAYRRPVMVSTSVNSILNWLDTLGEELTVYVVGDIAPDKAALIVKKVISDYRQ